MFWPKAYQALSRVAARYSSLIAQSDGDGGGAGCLLWAQSRSDPALREDLVKAACILLSCVSPEVDKAETGPASQLKCGPRRLSKCDLDPEVGTFVRERLGTMTCRSIADQAASMFGRDRAPSKSSIHSYWVRLANE